MCFPMTVWCPYSRSMSTCFALARSVIYKSNQPLIHDGNHWDTTLERGPSLPDTPPMKTKVKIAEVGWDHIKERAIMGVIEDKPEMSTTKRPRKKSYGEGRTKEERARALKEVETWASTTDITSPTYSNANDSESPRKKPSPSPKQVRKKRKTEFHAVISKWAPACYDQSEDKAVSDPRYKSRGICELDDFDNFDSLVKGDNNIEYQGQSRKRSSMTSDGTSAVGASEWSIALDDSFKQQPCINDQGSILTTPKRSTRDNTTEPGTVHRVTPETLLSAKKRRTTSLIIKDCRSLSTNLTFVAGREITDADIFKSNTSYENFAFLIVELHKWSLWHDEPGASMGLKEHCVIYINSEWDLERRLNFDGWVKKFFGVECESFNGRKCSYFRCSVYKGKCISTKLQNLLYKRQD